MIACKAREADLGTQKASPTSHRRHLCMTEQAESAHLPPGVENPERYSVQSPRGPRSVYYYFIILTFFFS